MPLFSVDVHKSTRTRQSEKHQAVKRRNSVTFGVGSKHEKRRGSTGATTYYYNDKPTHIPAPPINPFTISTPRAVVLANPTSTSQQPYHIPGAFPTTETSTYKANPLPHHYYTAPLKPEGPSEPRQPTLTRSRSHIFADYLPSLPSLPTLGANWTGLLGGGGNSNSPSKEKAMADDAKKKIEHERKLRLLAEQRHQETIKQQLLELEILKTTQELEQRKAEDEARARLHDVCMVGLAEQQAQHHQALQLYHQRYTPSAVPGHHHHHYYSDHFEHDHYAEEVARRRWRKEHHYCSRCGHRGHYSKRCTVAPPSRMLGPAEAPVRGYLEPADRVGSSVGGYSTDDEDWGVVDEFRGEVAMNEEGYPVATCDDRHNGVLVYYEGGAAPGTVFPRNSVRHVVGV